MKATSNSLCPPFPCTRVHLAQPQAVGWKTGNPTLMDHMVQESDPFTALLSSPGPIRQSPRTETGYLAGCRFRPHLNANPRQLERESDGT